MEQALKDLFGFDRRQNIQADTCSPPPMGCSGPATEFRDDISRKEFAISGMCQKCQDGIYGKEDDT